MENLYNQVDVLVIGGGLAGLMTTIFKNKWAGYIVFAAAFIFLIPYVAIQIRGISMFFTAIFPNEMTRSG